MVVELGLLLRRRREERKLMADNLYGQGAVARRVGIAQSVLSDLERGRVSHLPEPAVLNALARDLGLSVQSLLQAAGYDLVSAEAAAALQAQAVRECDLSAVLSVQYRLSNEEAAAVKLLVSKLRDAHSQQPVRSTK